MSTTGSEGAAVAGAAVNQFLIPPLNEGDHFQDWQPLFSTAITGLLTCNNGEKLARLLPGYINRHPAELKLLIRDAVQMNVLAEAFGLLKTLNDPIDPYEVMQHLCRANWLCCEKIDEFYYHLKKKAKQVDVKLELICSIFIGQLPKHIQGKVKAFYVKKRDYNGTISEQNACLLIMRVKQLFSECGIALDIGCLKGYLCYKTIFCNKVALNV